MTQTDKIREAFDNISNDEEAKKMLRDAVAKQLEEKKNRRRKINVICRFAASFIVVAGISAAFAVYNFAAAYELSIDINSVGVQMSLSRAGRVINYYYNEGNSSVIDVKGMNIGKAIPVIITASGAAESSSALAVVSVRGNNAKGTNALRATVEDRILKESSAENINMALYNADPGGDATEFAKNEGVTTGKYYLIKLVQATNFELQTGELAKYGSDVLVGMFVENYHYLLESIKIEEDEVPLSSHPGELPSETKLPESAADSLTEEEIAEQYAILSGLIK